MIELSIIRVVTGTCTVYGTTNEHRSRHEYVFGQCHRSNASLIIAERSKSSSLYYERNTVVSTSNKTGTSYCPTNPEKHNNKWASQRCAHQKDQRSATQEATFGTSKNAPQSAVCPTNGTDWKQSIASKGFPVAPTDQRQRLLAPLIGGAPPRARALISSDSCPRPDTGRRVSASPERPPTAVRHCGHPSASNAASIPQRMCRVHLSQTGQPAGPRRMVP